MSGTRTDVAMDNLVRSVPFELVRDDAGDEGDGRTFCGYAATFNEPTVIDSWEGRFEEEIAPGAFRKSLRERKPVFQFDHGRHPMVGSIPLGAHAADSPREDDRGVYVENRLHDNWLTQPVRDAIASGAIDGMSFRFEVVRDRWTDTKTGKVLKDRNEIIRRLYDPRPDEGMLRRTLLEVKCRELGPVVFPAYEGTSAEVRSVTLDLERLDDPDQRRHLARAVLLADQADTTDSPDSPEGTDDTSAVDHEDREQTEPPQATPTAGEHGSESAEPAGLRDRINRRRSAHAARLRFALEGAHRYA